MFAAHASNLPLRPHVGLGFLPVAGVVNWFQISFPMLAAVYQCDDVVEFEPFAWCDCAIALLTKPVKTIKYSHLHSRWNASVISLADPFLYRSHAATLPSSSEGMPVTRSMTPSTASAELWNLRRLMAWPLWLAA